MGEDGREINRMVDFKIILLLAEESTDVEYDRL